MTSEEFQSKIETLEREKKSLMELYVKTENRRSFFEVSAEDWMCRHRELEAQFSDHIRQTEGELRSLREQCANWSAGHLVVLCSLAKAIGVLEKFASVFTAGKELGSLVARGEDIIAAYTATREYLDTLPAEQLDAYADAVVTTEKISRGLGLETDATTVTLSKPQTN